MVIFELTMGGYNVRVGEKMFGHIDGQEGFFLDPTTIREFLRVSSDDMRKVADKADETIHRYNLELGGQNMNEKTKLFLFVLAKHISWEKLEECFTEVEEVYCNQFPTNPFPPFKQRCDELVGRLEKK